MRARLASFGYGYARAYRRAESGGGDGTSKANMEASKSKKRVCVSLVPLARRPLRSSRHVVPTTHRKLLLEVAFKLRPCEVDELRFSVKDAVPDETAADALTALGLLECLERHKLLGPEKYAILRGYLEEMGRRDLADRLAPPEELGASTRTRPAIPGTLSRIAKCLDINCTVWPYSTYRRNALKVFRELGEGEVEQVRWLSQDFFSETSWANEMTGVELLNTLESSCLLGPGNYTFLIDCLEEIGRPDLMIHIMPPSLPHLPASMDIPALLRHRHFENIELKKKQYQFGIRNLMMVTQMASQNTTHMAVGWHKRILGALSPKYLEAHSSFIIENLPTTLINMSLHINDLLDSVQEYERHGDTAKFARHVSDCEQHLDILQSLMEEIDWDHTPRKRESIATSRQYHPVRQASYGAFSGIAELLLEFSGSRERLQEESRLLSKKLTRLESLLRLSGYMWSLTSWLIALLQVAVRSPVSLSRYDSLFRLLVHRNRHIIRSNSDMLDTVLSPTSVGRELLKGFRKNDLVTNPEEGGSDPVLLHVAATPIPVFAFVLLLLSQHPSLASSDLEEIVASLKLYVSSREEGFCRINGDVTMMVLQGIGRDIETFRYSKIQEFETHNVHGHGIADIFNL